MVCISNLFFLVKEVPDGLSNSSEWWTFRMWRWVPVSAFLPATHQTLSPIPIKLSTSLGCQQAFHVLGHGTFAVGMDETTRWWCLPAFLASKRRDCASGQHACIKIEQTLLKKAIPAWGISISQKHSIPPPPFHTEEALGRGWEENEPAITMLGILRTGLGLGWEAG